MCCLVSLGQSPGESLAIDVWAYIGAPRRGLCAFDPLFPYKALEEMGRRPKLIEFSICVDRSEAEHDVIEDTTFFISLFQDLTDSDRMSVQRAVSDRADGGLLRWREEKMVRVLYWSADIRNGPC
jgi:hypothetical protein